MAITNHKNKLSISYLEGKKNKSLLQTHCRSALDTALPSEKARRDGFNITAKDCTTTLKKATHAIKATTRKANQTKYCKVSILCLYLII